MGMKNLLIILRLQHLGFIRIFLLESLGFIILTQTTLMHIVIGNMRQIVMVAFSRQVPNASFPSEGSMEEVENEVGNGPVLIKNETIVNE